VGSEPLTIADEELARQTRAGSLVAFEELVRRYGPRIYSFIAQTCRNRNDAAEITQDSFVRAFQGISRYDPSRKFAPWLFTLARHATVDHFRRKPQVGQEPPTEEIDYNDPSELVARREDSLQLWRLARRHLPEIQFQVLWLHYAEDMSVAKVAQVLRKTRIHIKVLLYRARRALAQELPAEHEHKKSRTTSTSHPRPEAVLARG
jgi:RNA polymerase sigma-70 factor (ECF subfamily)